ncbi:MAG: tRNA uridine-5-carboxymethylaminomethyl(34) synthesis GTPase MnmE [Chitinophaga sp.]|nr:tRNA uridine-5-carboxymethylaminomethyl(34) synthesis GTPase MnmE [Chitinophaga sp.]PJE48186.1 MAG: tRNA uridine-5-carboxymethylaminomethyl(34) synthesis GTPase MnmE [Sediminibacterium sp.] [Sediminibacterium sp. FEMGT703S]
MNTALQGWDDTIVALATAPGIGAIAVIRISGPATFEVINQLFPKKDLLAQASHTIHVGLLKDGDTVLDEVVLSLYRGPKSYTGEDVIEISCHGSPYIQEQILQAITKLGVRMAKPGEFTQRAFLKGKMDLAQAEAVADLIASNTEASKKAALHTMRGGFSSDLTQLREALISFSALIELELDFSQEDVEFADRTQFKNLISQLKEATAALIGSFKLGNVIKNGVQVAIIGKPNAGKSTLLNTLLNENRAIVSDIAGTTRDTIEEVLNIEGVLFRLIDTAGIREHTDDAIEQIGVSKSKEKMRAAQVVVYLYDLLNISAAELQQIVNEFEQEQINYILVGNKADLANAETVKQFAAFKNSLFISAKNNEQIDALKKSLVNNTIHGNINTESTIVTNARHYEALVGLMQSLEEVEQGLHNRLPGDLLALDIRQCLHYLGTITGSITHEDQLDYIFSKFCIGK